VSISAPRNIAANFSSASGITITTSPIGMTFTVDGISYVSAQSFNWTAGSLHTISATSPQGSDGTRYAFANWSDGGGINHTIITPTSATTYTANFNTQYLLTTTSLPAPGGTFNVSPTSADGFYNSGAAVQLTATANPGYIFSGWSGNLAGMINPQMVVVSQFLSVTGSFSAGPHPLTLNPGGADTHKTAGGNSTTRTGYVKLAVNSGTTPYGTAVFSFSQDGMVVSEAGVPASPPTRSARLFIDYRKGVNALPVQSDAGSIDTNTGIAVMNYCSSTANVTYTLRDPNGIAIATGSGRIEAAHHFACFIDQLKNNGVPDFNLPADFQSRIQFGSLDVSADQPLSVLALRGTTNQRNEFLITTTPIADITQVPGNGSVYFPQFVDGGGYTTSLMLLNTSSVRETGKLEIRDKDGNPLTVNQVGGTNDSSFSYSIEPGGLFRFQTDGFPADTKAGWVRLTPDAGTPTPVGSGVFGYNPENVMVSESGIPAAVATMHARVYVDLSNNHNTGLAIANISNTGSNITIKAYQKDGVTVAGASKPPIPLPQTDIRLALPTDS